MLSSHVIRDGVNPTTLVGGELLGTASAKRVRDAKEMAAEIACKKLGIST